METTTHKQLEQLVPSCTSLSELDEKGLKKFIPQIVAAFIVLSFHIVVGISYAYSAIVIPQLVEEQNKSRNITDSETLIEVSETELSWIASVLPTVVFPAAIVGGILIDSVGRLNTLKLAAIPNALGWILIATASNFSMLIIGRMLTGTSIALGAAPAIIYTSEISTPNIRGALIALGPCFVSFGMMLAYLEGTFLNWRIVAWTCVVYTIIPIAFVIMFIPESPPWLISKNRPDDARRSLKWLNKYRSSENGTTSAKTYSEIQLALFQNDYKANPMLQTKLSFTQKLGMFAKPTVYKPFLILSGLYFFQQFAGLFIILFYAVTFFNAVGTSISAYVAAIMVGAARLCMSLFAVVLMKRFKRRSLIMISGIGMGITITISGYFTDLIREGKTSLNWIPTTMILLYVASSMIGYLGIPWTIISEIFPTEVRGLAHSISFGMAHIIMFASIQSYFSLVRWLGGLAHMQYFFAAVSFGGVLYCYLLLPETHNKKLCEIQEYFERYWTYLSVPRNDRKSAQHLEMYYKEQKS